MQPSGRYVYGGDTVTLHAEAQGSLPLFYQWLFNEQPIPGATSNRLVFVAWSTNQAGNYRVIASNAYGAATSEVAAVTVSVSWPLFSMYQPVSQGAIVGETVTLRAQAYAHPPPTLQWLFNGAPLAGATNEFLTLAHVTTNQTGTYFAVASNLMGVCTSRVATVSVYLPGPLERWTWRYPLPQGNSLFRAAYGNGVFVAVGEWGAKVTSSDGGVTWRSCQSSGHLSSIAFGNDRFVAIGNWWNNQIGRIETRIQTSTNGTIWKEFDAPVFAGFGINDVAFGNGRFVAACGSSRTAVSTNGTDWTVVPMASSNSLLRIIFANGLFVATTLLSDVTPTGVVARIAISLDGVTWTERSLGLASRLQDLAGGDGVFMTLGQSLATGTDAVFVSSDLFSWTAYLPPEDSEPTAIAYGAGQYVLVGDDPNGLILSSPDGVAWESHWSSPSNELYGVTYGGGQFVAVGQRGNIFTSPDGATWTTRSGGTDVNFRCVARGNGLYVAVGNEGLLFTSPNGVDWTRQPPPIANNLRGIAYGAGRFVAVGESDAAGGTVLVSSNAVQWTRLVASTTPSLYDITFAQDRFVAVGSGGAMVSPDGLNWANRVISNQKLNSVTWGNGNFVAVGRYQAILTSPDGTNWTLRAGGDDDVGGPYLQGVAYGNGVFVAAGKNGSLWVASSNLTYLDWPLSPWTVEVEDMLFAHGLFIAVGTEGFCATSSDGFVWTIHPTRCQNDLRAIIYEEGRFTAVGNNDTIVQSDFLEPPLPAMITRQPVSRTNYIGETATFTVEASGTPPLSYEWWIWVGPIPGATNATLVLTNVQPANALNYAVIVSNVAGMYFSDVVSLTVLPNTSLAEALDGPGLEWRTGTSRHSRPWMGQTNVTQDGRDAALGSLRDGECWLETTVTGPGLLDFWWAVSVPPEFGQLSVAMDGAGRVSIAGNVDWIQQSLVIPDGLHVLRWSFTNENHYAIASAWLDQVLFTPTATNPPIIVVQPVSQTRFVGEAANFTVEATGMAPLRYQWFRDEVPLSGATNATLSFASVQFADAGSYWVIVSNAAGSVFCGYPFLTVLPAAGQPGSVDLSFDPGSGADDTVSALALRQDSKILLGGAFTSFNGVPRQHVAQLLNDGRVDLGFNPGTGADFNVYAVAAQSDGRVLIGGGFTNFNGQPQRYLAQLRADGSLDAGFAPQFNQWGWVIAVAVQGDGKIVIGGYFTSVNGVTRNRIARLNPDGSLDASFQPTPGVDAGGSIVMTLDVQPDGKVVLGGVFERVNGVVRRHVARLHRDGTLDTGFDPGAGTDSTVNAVALQPDGKVILGGGFTVVNGVSRHGLARLHANGSVDLSFDPGTGVAHSDAPAVHALAVQPDGKVLAAGWFDWFNGVRRTHLARLNPDGSLDPTFAAHIESGGWGGCVSSVALQPDGQVLITGNLESVNGTPRRGIARLNNHIVLAEPRIISSPVSQTRFVGQTATFSVAAIGTPPLAYQWLLDGAPIAGATNATLTLSNVQLAHAGSYAVVVSNPEANVTSALATLTVLPVPSGPGSLDVTLDPTAGGTLLPLASDEADVDAIFVQPDGKVIVGGYFCGVNGVPRNGIARLHPDGQVDGSFNPGMGVDGRVCAVARQRDGKILIAGDFTYLNGQPRQSVARLHPDGSLDAAFHAGVTFGAQWDAVRALAVQDDGRIWMGGSFSNVNGVAWRDLARLHPDGALDTSFNPATVPNKAFAGVFCLQLQPDGKLLVGDSNRRLTRLHADGSVEAGFTPQISGYSVYSIALRPDGRIVIGGNFSDVGGAARPGLAQLWPDGSLDAGFVVSVETGGISAVLIQPDGRVLLSRWSYSSEPEPRTPLLRLLPDGAVDPSFVPGSVSEPWSFPVMNALALQADGKIWLGQGVSTRTDPTCALVRFHADGSRDGGAMVLVLSQGDTYSVYVSCVVPVAAGQFMVGGGFTSVNGVRRNGLARLQPDGRLDATFVPDVRGDFEVTALARQPDGKWLVGGFGRSSDWPVTHRGLFRLRADGSYDASFQFFAAAFDEELYVREIILLPDGRILACGNFGPAYGSLVRLLADGSLDTSFHPPLILATGDSGIYDMCLQPDGKLMICGYWMFTTAADGLARLNPDGSVDDSFDAGSGVDWDVNSILPQPDAGYVIGGDFGSYNGAAVASIIRLRADGSLDESFQSELGHKAIWGLAQAADGKLLASVLGEGIVRLQPDGRLDSSFHAALTWPVKMPWARPDLIQADGRIWIGGSFTTVNGIAAFGLARLNGDAPVPPPFVQRRIAGPRVELGATPTAGVSVYAVEDQPPQSWAVTNISHSGAFDARTGKVKFGPFFDAEPRTLSYDLFPPPGAQGVFVFTGTASADGLNSPIVGDDRIVPPWPHPADRERPEWSLSIGEVTAYGAAWRRGETWPLPPNPIPIDYVTRAAFLWRGGECYRFDDRTNAPLLWVNCDGGSSLASTPATAGGNVSASQAQRQMPAAFVPGEPLPVTIATHPGGVVRAYAVEDAVPTGWTVSTVSHGGELDAVNGKVKWGPFLDATARDLSYQAVSPASASGAATFAGTASFDGARLMVAGPRQISVGSRLRVALDLATGRLALSLVGPVGSRYLIESSTDLTRWLPLMEVTASPDGTTVPLGRSPSEPQRFYRAQLIP
jgi:uncharacterized delta-60 repeat protein